MGWYRWFPTIARIQLVQRCVLRPLAERVPGALAKFPVMLSPVASLI